VRSSLRFVKSPSLFFSLPFVFLISRRSFASSRAAMSDSGGDGGGVGAGADAPRAAKPMTNADFRALLDAPRPDAATASKKKKDNAGQQQRRRNQQQLSSRDGDGGSKYRCAGDGSREPEEKRERGRENDSSTGLAHRALPSSSSSSSSFQKHPTATVPPSAARG
jgi:hypothetical protein